jgi:two-component system, OmpR family, response regulator QseB
LLTQVLIAEDEPRIAKFLEKGLRAAGYATTLCTDGVCAAAKARDEDFDVVILDLGLPGQDGLEVLHAMRRRGERLPVLVLTARNRVEDSVAALDAGADDYVSKPFVFDELLARLRARMQTKPHDREAMVLAKADLRLDLHTRSALVGDALVQLTARECKLLETFLRHAGEVLTREQVVARVWDGKSDLAGNIVDVYVSSLRRKLGAERFETIRGVGYRMPVA